MPLTDLSNTELADAIEAELQYLYRCAPEDLEQHRSSLKELLELQKLRSSEGFYAGL